MGISAEELAPESPHGDELRRGLRFVIAMPAKTKTTRNAATKSPRKRHAAKVRTAKRSAAASQPRLTRSPIAKAEMLIRKPAAEVFESFVNPDITTQFWFTKSSGRLEPGSPVKWEWEMYNVSTNVAPKVIERNRRILIEWDGYSGRTKVEWKFRPLKNDTTFVSVTESGWTGSGDELAKYATDSTEGFTWTLAGLKALLEHGVRLNVVADRFPEGVEKD
jgi:uncharacterized protein YndB with AHSA1/START domain